ncbi:hypothetical protein IFT84_20440 [Rhizobium sp. CFBP 8762]|uniref:hypothetical protein n=1 Tax=Rhizobium sp. CFBP 8762 TaxID=2775279 RepID=UPI0017851588|nr:hypothetical protein [Rhizobium sp. CFBP 8762]MBD8556882.1 hypothetical protein [Rhizobium sp. CFBP 8762]
MTDILLHIVTDDPAFAAMEVLQCRPAEVPLWAKLVSDPKRILALPKGAKCIGIMHSMRPHLTLAHCAWLERQERNDLARGLTDQEIDIYRDWVRRGHTLTPPSGDRNPAPAQSAPPTAPPAPATDHITPLPPAVEPSKPKQPRWK